MWYEVKLVEKASGIALQNGKVEAVNEQEAREKYLADFPDNEAAIRDGQLELQLSEGAAPAAKSDEPLAASQKRLEPNEATLKTLRDQCEQAATMTQSDCWRRTFKAMQAKVRECELALKKVDASRQEDLQHKFTIQAIEDVANTISQPVRDLQDMRRDFPLFVQALDWDAEYEAKTGTVTVKAVKPKTEKSKAEKKSASKKK